jgi:glycosyltransferase involved in cell wall biosynthesis
MNTGLSGTTRATRVGPIVVTGMHRSGTSMAAALVRSAGVSVRNDDVGPKEPNRHGYFEDAEFLALHREMLDAATAGGTGGHPDWGWTETEHLDLSVLEAFRDRAKHLIHERLHNSDGMCWGWKDPRTVILLPFWDQLLPPTTQYVFVYRRPWDVADSMQRLGADVFLSRPDYAWRIWNYYNRQLLDFHLSNRDRTLLVSAEALRRDPEPFFDLLDQRLGMSDKAERPDPATIVDSNLFPIRNGDDPLVALASLLYPEVVALVRQMDEAADLLPDVPATSAPVRPLKQTGSAEESAPRLSVVIPCYNQGEYLAESIASVERCVDERCELIIVNDGSTDPRTLQVLELLRSAGYLVVDQDNRGVSVARNKGIELARGIYILPLDADNRLRPQFVARALERLDSDPATGVVYSDRQDFGLRNETVDVPPFDPGLLLVANFIDACAVFRKDLWREVGGYDANISAWADWDFWLSAITQGWGFSHLEFVGFDYRVRPNSLLAQDQDLAIRRQWCENLTTKHADLYRRWLPSVVLAAQRYATNLFVLARQHERMNAESADRIAALETQLHAVRDRSTTANDASSISSTLNNPAEPVKRASLNFEPPQAGFEVPPLILPKPVNYDPARADGILARIRMRSMEKLQALLHPFRQQKSINKSLAELAALQTKLNGILANRVDHLSLCVQMHHDMFRSQLACREMEQTYLRDVGKAILSTDNKLQELELSSSNHQLQTAAAHAEIQSLVAGLADLGTRIEALADNLRLQASSLRSDLQSQLDPLGSRIANVQQQLDNLVTHTTNLQMQTDALGRHLRSELDPMSRQVDNIKTRTDSLHAEVTALAQATKPALEELELLRNQLERFQAHANWIGRHINDLTLLPDASKFKPSIVGR